MKVIIEAGETTGVTRPDIEGICVSFGDLESDSVIGDEIRVVMLYRHEGKLIEVDDGVFLTTDNASLLKAALEVFINKQP